MNKLLFLITTLLVLSSCKKKNVEIENPQLIGTWDLVDVYLDPGDGSGDFALPNYQKEIEFSADGMVISSGSLCRVGVLVDAELGEGTYDETDSTISPFDCPAGVQTRYEIVDGKLILSFMCIEACQERFVKTDD